MIYPNTFIVGQPKSGTSALYAFLKEHPQVCVSSTKEPQYFCNDLRSQYFYIAGLERNEGNYLKLFRSRKHHKAILEASTAYLYSKVAAREIYSFNRKAKIIIMLREPVDFLYAYHLQMLRTSCVFEDEMNFEHALELEELRKSGKNIPDKCLEPTFLFYSERIKYTEQIIRYRDVFSRDQIMIIIYDDFKKNNEKTYNDVVEFLGLDNTFKPNYRIVNPGVKVRFRKTKQTIDKTLYSLKQLIKLYMPSWLFNIIRKIYRNIIFDKINIHNLDNKTKYNCMVQYKDEVKKLSKYLDRDLVALWGYDNI